MGRCWEYLAGGWGGVHQVCNQRPSSLDLVQRSCTECLCCLAGVSQKLGQSVGYCVHADESVGASIAKQLKVNALQFGFLPGAGWMSTPLDNVDNVDNLVFL